jgi:hypothetical protein
MRRVLLCLPALLLGAGLPVGAAAPARHRGQVKDAAKLFSPKAVREATKKLQKMAADYHLDAVIETIPSLSDEERQQLGSWRVWPMKGRVLAELAQKRAEKGKLDGVYVAIWAAPEAKEVTIVLWPTDRYDVLGGGGRQSLRRAFLRDLADQPDRALRVGVDELGALLHKHFTSGSTTALSGWGALIVVGACLGVWLVLLTLRSRLRRAPEEATDPVERRPAVLATLFGMPAGYWVYDRLFRAGGPIPSLVGTPLPLLAPPAPPDSEAAEEHPAESHEMGPDHDQAPFA